MRREREDSEYKILASSVRQFPFFKEKSEEKSSLRAISQSLFYFINVFPECGRKLEFSRDVARLVERHSSQKVKFVLDVRIKSPTESVSKLTRNRMTR